MTDQIDETFERHRHVVSSDTNFLSKNSNILVMGVLAAAGALVWNTVVESPQAFATLSQQTTEIRTTVLEMRSIVTDLSKKIDDNQRQTADQQARLTGLESMVQTNRDDVSELTERVRDLERRRAP